MTNESVVESWKNNVIASTKNLRTDGLNLYSYNLRIGYTENGIKVAIDHTAASGSFYSKTTSKHVSYAKKKSDIVETPNFKM